MAADLKEMYKTIMDDHFPPKMEISFIDGEKRQTLLYDKVDWIIDNVKKGLRYGENPGQEAALYRLVNGNLVLGGNVHDPAGELPGVGYRTAAVGQTSRQNQPHRRGQCLEHPALFFRSAGSGDRQA